MARENHAKELFWFLIRRAHEANSRGDPVSALMLAQEAIELFVECQDPDFGLDADPECNTLIPATLLGLHIKKVYGLGPMELNRSAKSVGCFLAQCEREQNATVH